ncbi:MAG TPA: hypothetical protein VHC70_09460 [Phycisphaerales bacterium]|nr:hypothetical protein [Phycisphaerales bacterium]
MYVSTVPSQVDVSPPLIHCIGDSHAGFFAGQDAIQPLWPTPAARNLHGVAAYRLGPFLAHSVCNPRHRVRKLIEGILAGLYAPNRVLLGFGEIDCRRHIVPIAKEKGWTIARVAQDVALRYVETAAWLRDQTGIDGEERGGDGKGGGVEFGVWGVTPTAGGEVKNPRYWPSGTWEERKEATREFNAGLARACSGLGLMFASICDEVVHPDGTLRTEYFMDDIHLGQAAVPLARRALARVGWIGAGAEGETGLAMTHVDTQLIAGGWAMAHAPATNLPEGVKAALIDRAALECARAGRRRVALFGAGAHTRRFTLEPYRRRGLEVVAILDDRSVDTHVLGVPVLRPERAPKDVQAVIISTDAAEEAMLARARETVGIRGVEVVPVYTYAAPAPTPVAA